MRGTNEAARRRVGNDIRAGGIALGLVAALAAPLVSRATAWRGETAAGQVAAQERGQAWWVDLDRASITGTVAAGRVVSASVLSGGGAGALLASAVATAGPTGEVMLRLQAPDAIDGPTPRFDFADGDVLWLDAQGGDPRRSEIPPLAAIVGEQGHQLAGHAPPAATLALELRQPIGDGRGDRYLARAEARAGIDGRWRVPPDAWRLSGSPSVPLLAPPRYGLVRWHDEGAFVFERRWAAIAITAGAGSATLHGSGAPHRTPIVTVTDRAGRIVGGGSGGASGLEGSVSWSVELEDRFGSPAAVASGDEILVRIGAQQARWRVPPLAAALDTAAEQVAGSTSPGRQVHLRVLRQPVVERQATAGDDGRFTFELSDVVDLHHDDPVELKVPEGHHVWSAWLRSPALRLDLDSGWLHGWAEPGSGPRVRQLRAGAPLGVWTLDGGDFDLWLGAATGEDSAALRPGDVIELTMPERAAGDRRVRLVVPTFSLALDGSAGRLDGQVDPPILPQLVARAAFFGSPAVAAWGGGAIEARLEEQGRLVGRFPGATGPLPPGLLVEGHLWLPEGHLVLRRTATAALELQLEGPLVCGFGPPGASVVVDVRDEQGRPSGLLRTTTGPRGRFALPLQAIHLAQPRLRGGAQVRAQVGEETIAVEIPTVTVSVDWIDGVVEGQLPVAGLGAGTGAGAWRLRWPSSGCVADTPADAVPGAISGLTLRPDARGAFSALVPTGPGALTRHGIALEHLSPGGHRYVRHLRPATLDLFVDRARVELHGGAYAVADLALLDATEGRPRAWLALTADGRGQDGGSWRDTLGRPVAARAGERVIGRAGGAAIDVLLEPLSFDYAPATGIDGLAAPARTVTLRLVGPDDVAFGGSGRLLELETDERGHFAVHRAPPRAGWSLDDLLRIELSAPVRPPAAAGHRLLATWSRDERPALTGRVWLPWLGRPR